MEVSLCARPLALMGLEWPLQPFTARNSHACVVPSSLPLPLFPVGHDSIITNSVQRLLPLDAALLVKAVLQRLQSAPARGEQLVAWVRAVLLHHTGFLVGMQSMQVGATGWGGVCCWSAAAGLLLCWGLLLGSRGGGGRGHGCGL